MNIDLIDNIFLSETQEDYFYGIIEGDTFYYGGCYEDGALADILMALYDREPLSRPDLIRFAQSILHSTDS
jgi:hypothetical protein